MAKKVKAIATETRVASVFAADGLTAQQAISDAIAHGVHNGRYTLVSEAIQYGARRSAVSKSALYAVWCSVVEMHYTDSAVYDDETCGRALCNALKSQGLRGETPDATAAKCRAWLGALVKAENAKRKAEKERLAAEKAAREAERQAVLDAAAKLAQEEALEAERLAALRASAIDSTCVEKPEVALLPLFKVEKPARKQRVQKDATTAKGEPRSDTPKSVRKPRSKKVA